MLTQDPGEVFEAIYESGTTGLVGNLAVAIHDNQSIVVFGPTELNIVELIVDGQATGTYRAMLTAPATLGQYSINWSNDGSFDPQAGGAEEDLFVEDTTLSLPSLGAEVGAILCSAWTTAEDVVECCSAEIGSDTTFLEASIVSASELLYEASGRRFPGFCERTVRACEDNTCPCCQVLSRGHIVSSWSNWGGLNWGWLDWGSCTCDPGSRIKLAGYATEISEVTINGDVVDPSEYHIDEHRWLVRDDGTVWPCQTLVTYVYGKAPPVSGQLAAQELACEIVKSCTPGVECALPSGVTRITRQGITIERSFFVRNKDGIWATGMGSVDFFLNTFNSAGIPRRATVWSPSSRARYARPSAA